MLRVIHTADIHLDMCFASLGASAGFGNRRRQGLRDVFMDIIRRAGEWPADAVLLAGDLFELDRLNRDTVAFLQSCFNSIPHVPVFIAPGNHDPYVPSSPYATETWPANVTIFKTPEWRAETVAGGRLTVHGFAFDGPDLSKNPFGTLVIEQNGSVHVAVGHGSERRHQPPEKQNYAPFDAHTAATEGLDYLALGHFHSLTPIENESATTIYYSGAPEGHGFGETGVCCYLELEMDAGQVHVRPVASSRVVYSAYSVDCTDFTTTQELVEAIRTFANRSSLPQIARVVLNGAASPALQAGLSAIYDAVSGQFEHIEMVDATRPAEDYATLARETTSLGAFIRKLSEECADAPDAAQIQLLERAREVGLAAFRGYELGIRGFEGGER